MVHPILQHTWYIRTASTCCVSPLQTSRLPSLEEDLTAFVRRIHASTTTSLTTTTTSNSNYKPNNDCGNEMHASFSWVELKNPARASSYHAAEGDCDGSIGASSTNPSTVPCENHRHLHISVQAQHKHAPKAQLLLCFCQGFPDIVSAFSFLMVQGSNPMLQSLFRWLESRTGVIISQRPFGFTSSQVAKCMTMWTSFSISIYEQQQNKQRDQSGSMVEDYEEGDVFSATTPTTATINTSSTTFATTNGKGGPKPLDLTFAVPEVVASKGLDTISLSILPVDLVRLCRDIHDRRPHDSNMTSDDSDTFLDNFAQEAPLPILKALQCYILEVFHIDIRSFPLIRASSSTAMLSCDGRCQIHDEYFLPLVLQDIRNLVQKRVASVSALEGNDLEPT